MNKRILALIIVLTIVLAYLPASSLADTTTIITNKAELLAWVGSGTP